MPNSLWPHGLQHGIANKWGNNANSDRLYFLGFQNHCRWWLQPEIKGCLLLRRETMTNLDSILKSRDITLPTKVHLVKAVVFSSSHVQMWELDHKEGWVSKNWHFWTMVLEDQTSQCYRKSALNLHWKDWCWSSNTLATWCEELTHWKGPWSWERLRTREEGVDRGWDG